jgi:hypothetical protein
VRIELAHQLGFELGQRDARRGDRQVLDRRRQHDVAKPDVRLRDRVVNALRDLRHVEERQRAVGLGIEIDEQGSLAAQREGRRQIDRGGGLPDTTLLICDGDDHHPRRSEGIVTEKLRALIG